MYFQMRESRVTALSLGFCSTFIRLQSTLLHYFLLTTKNCPPTVYNYISANDDPYNETFFIKGLRDVFINFKIEIYNRWGRMVWKGTNNDADWNGFSNKGFKFVQFYIKKSQEGEGKEFFTKH